jgi:translation initiation factor IF-2
MATILIQKGTLNIGDIVVAGTSYGKVKKMVDSKSKNLKTATPSMPIEILGLDRAPNAGDQFSVVTEEKQARDVIAYRSKKERDEKALKNSARSIDDIFKDASSGSIKYLPVIIKGDVHGSVEAIVGSLTKLNTDEVAIKIIHQATGGISESDVNLAEVAGAIIVGFNVRANNATKELAREKNIDVRYHSIIYNVVDEIKLLLGGMLDPVKNEEFLGQAEIRQVFKVSGSGKIAGCFVTSGLIKRGAKVRLLRDDIVVYDGALKTLKRFKDDVKEVKNNFECGCAFENYDDMMEKDIIECYEIVETQRKI